MNADQPSKELLKALNDLEQVKDTAPSHDAQPVPGLEEAVANAVRVLYHTDKIQQAGDLNQSCVIILSALRPLFDRMQGEIASLTLERNNYLQRFGNEQELREQLELKVNEHRIEHRRQMKACQRKHQELEKVEEENRRLRELLKQATCSHNRTSGGNDYILCDECGLEWDYRKETAHMKLIEHVDAALRGGKEQENG